MENQWAKKYPSRNVISKTPFTIGHYYASLSIQSAFRAFKMREQMSIETKQTTSIDDTNDDKADKRMEL